MWRNSTRKEEIDNGHLRYRNKNGGCSSPGEVCVSKIDLVTMEFVDALTQQKDTSYERLCVHISVFEGERQEELQPRENLIDYTNSLMHFYLYKL